MADLSSLEELRDAVAGAPPSRRRRSASRSATASAAPTPPASARTPSPGSGSSRASGKVVVNGKEMNVYFARPVLQMVIGQAFSVAGVAGEFDVMATVKGGGLSGQAGAVKHGISQALTLYEPLAAPGAQGRGLPDPRQPRRRAQEVRQAQGAPQLPVLQALIRDRLRTAPAAA